MTFSSFLHVTICTFVILLQQKVSISALLFFHFFSRSLFLEEHHFKRDIFLKSTQEWKLLKLAHAELKGFMR